MKHLVKIFMFFVSLTAITSLHADDQLQKINIIFIGNSITEARNQETTPPKAAAEYLISEGYQVKFENCGLSGYTTVNYRPPSGTFNMVCRAADVFYKDKNALLIFSIKLGTNDSAIKGPAGAPVSPENYKKNLNLLADSLHHRYPGCKIVLNYPIWYSADTQNAGAAYLEEGQNRLQSYFPEIKALADENPEYIFEGDKEAYTFFKENYLQYHSAQTSPSGKTYYLHPNQEGSVKLGEFWAKALQKILIEINE